MHPLAYLQDWLKALSARADMIARVPAAFLLPLPTEEAPVPAHPDFADIETELATALHMGRDDMIVTIRTAKDRAVERKAAILVECDAVIERCNQIEAAFRTKELDRFCAIPSPRPPVDERTAEQIEAMFETVAPESGEKVAA